jgi:membrane protein DedA with SNARE-associated domain
LRTPTILKISMADSLVQWIDQVISSFGYGGIATLMLLENLFPPIPSEAILPLVGFLVNRGDLAVIPALLATTLGSLVGALVLYALGRGGGRPLVFRYRRVLRVTEAELDRADGWFDRYGSWIVLFGRMVPLARSVVSIPAGMSEMPVWRFALLTASGSAVWNALLIGAGWILGENWVRVTGVIGSLSNMVLVIVVVGVVSLGVWWWRRRRQA